MSLRLSLVFTLFVSFIGTQSFANYFDQLQTGNYCRPQGNLTDRLLDWPEDFTSSVGLLLSPSLYEFENTLLEIQLLLTQAQLLQAGVLDAQKNASLSYFLLSNSKSSTIRQTAVGILSGAGVDVDFFEHRIIACAFDCQSGGISEVSQDFKICISQE